MFLLYTHKDAKQLFALQKECNKNLWRKTQAQYPCKYVYSADFLKKAANAESLNIDRLGICNLMHVYPTQHSTFIQVYVEMLFCMMESVKSKQVLLYCILQNKRILLKSRRKKYVYNLILYVLGVLKRSLRKCHKKQSNRDFGVS